MGANEFEGQTIEREIPANGYVRVVTPPYRNLFVRDVSDKTSANPVTLKLHQRAIECFTGLKLADLPETFTEIDLVNNTGAAVTVKLLVSNGNISDDSVKLSGALDTTPTVPQQLDDDANVTCPTGASTTVLAADSMRVASYITNLEPIGGQTIYVGDFPTGGRGLPLAPMNTLVIYCTDDIRVWHDKGSNVSVGILKTRYS